MTTPRRRTRNEILRLALQNAILYEQSWVDTWRGVTGEDADHTREESARLVADFKRVLKSLK